MMNRKELARFKSWPVLEQYSSVCLQKEEKTVRNVIQNNQKCCQYSHLIPFTWKSKTSIVVPT